MVYGQPDIERGRSDLWCGRGDLWSAGGHRWAHESSSTGGRRPRGCPRGSLLRQLQPGLLVSGAEDEGDSARAWARTGEEFSLLCVCVCEGVSRCGHWRRRQLVLQYGCCWLWGLGREGWRGCGRLTATWLGGLMASVFEFEIRYNRLGTSAQNLDDTVLMSR